MLFSLNSVDGVFEWLHLHRDTIRLREKDVYQFAVDMQQRLEIGKDILEHTAKSMAFHAFNAAEKHHRDSEGPNPDNPSPRNVLVLCNIFTMLSLPMHFGKVSYEEMRTMKREAAVKPTKTSVYRPWILNYWNYGWWSLCVMHTAFQTGIYNVDWPYLLQFGVMFPMVYPAVYVAISFRARRRVRKMQQIMLREQGKIQMRKSRANKIDMDSVA